MNNVIFIRHGQTEWNMQRRMQGSLNSPLTKKGIFQAKEAAMKLKYHRFDLVVSSPLVRAMETAKIIAEKVGVARIQADPAFAERHFGILEGMTSLKKGEYYASFLKTEFANSIIPVPSMTIS